MVPSSQTRQWPFTNALLHLDHTPAPTAARVPTSGRGPSARTLARPPYRGACPWAPSQGTTTLTHCPPPTPGGGCIHPKGAHLSSKTMSLGANNVCSTILFAVEVPLVTKYVYWEP